MIDIKIKLLDKSLPIPVYAHKTDAGIDLYSTISCVLKPFERKLIPSGVKLSIPEGYAGFVLPRSGLAIKNGISLVNSPGLIDSGYRGEICIIMINLDKEMDFANPHHQFFPTRYRCHKKSQTIIPCQLILIYTQC